MQNKTLCEYCGKNFESYKKLHFHQSKAEYCKICIEALKHDFSFPDRGIEDLLCTKAQTKKRRDSDIKAFTEFLEKENEKLRKEKLELEELNLGNREKSIKMNCEDIDKRLKEFEAELKQNIVNLASKLTPDEMGAPRKMTPDEKEKLNIKLISLYSLYQMSHNIPREHIQIAPQILGRTTSQGVGTFTSFSDMEEFQRRHSSTYNPITFSSQHL